MRAAGLRSGDVVVAVHGVRIHNLEQYNYARNSSSNPDLDLIVWQTAAYHEVHASPPDGRFGVDLDDYPSK